MFEYLRMSSLISPVPPAAAPHPLPACAGHTCFSLVSFSAWNQSSGELLKRKKEGGKYLGLGFLYYSPVQKQKIFANFLGAPVHVTVTNLIACLMLVVCTHFLNL